MIWEAVVSVVSFINYHPVSLLIGCGIGAWIGWHYLIWSEWNRFRAYVRDWCQTKVNDDELELTDAGVEAMVDYICGRMKDRGDRWDCELYISPSVYRRITNEYRRKER